MNVRSFSSFILPPSSFLPEARVKAWLLESPGGLSKITLGETSDPAPRLAR